MSYIYLTLHVIGAHTVVNGLEGNIKLGEGGDKFLNLVHLVLECSDDREAFQESLQLFLN